MDMAGHFLILLCSYVVATSMVILIIIFACCPREALRRHAHTQTDDQKPEMHVVVIHPDEGVHLSVST